ncbi:MAG: murein biosynthesis integral membrane protein MurJ [Planctomycetota bacterium]|jgi:putative peptidoglycan lipid II flippase
MDRSGAVKEGVAGPASRVSLATATSRVTGLLRESVFAAVIGAGGAASAFVLAFRIPNLLRDFFAEGALASAFVPTFARARRERGDAEAFLLARRVTGTLAVVTGVIALLGILFAPVVVAVVAPEAAERVRDLTIRLTRVMFPFLPLAALAAVAMGVLNTHRRYFLPALAPAFFNVVAVIGGLGMLALGWDRADRVEMAVTAWAVLVLVGGAAQILVQVPLLGRVGWRGPPVPDLRFRDPGVRQVARRMAPVILSLAGTNVMVVIVTALASRGLEWPAWLNYAFRLVHLPIGIVGVAVGTVVLAAGSRASAAGAQEDVDDLVRRGLRLNWFLALPAAAGLAVLAEPVIRMIYERGNFTATDTRRVAEALLFYAPGIVFYSGVKAAAPLFLSRGDTRTPMFCSLGGILVTLVSAFALVGTLEFRGLALAVGAGSCANYLLLRALGRRRYGPGSSPTASFLLRVALATMLMAAVGLLVSTLWLPGDEAVASRWGQAGLTLALTLVLAALYFVVAERLGVAEAAWARGRLPFLRRP